MEEVVRGECKASTKVGKEEVRVVEVKYERVSEGIEN